MISFGQSLVAADLERAEAAAARCDVLLAVGSTLSVWPIAGIVPVAAANGAAIVDRERRADRDGRARDRRGSAGAIEVVLPALVASLDGA